mgnify:FL=1
MQQKNRPSMFSNTTTSAFKPATTIKPKDTADDDTELDDALEGAAERLAARKEEDRLALEEYRKNNPRSDSDTDRDYGIFGRCSC